MLFVENLLFCPTFCEPWNLYTVSKQLDQWDQLQLFKGALIDKRSFSFLLIVLWQICLLDFGASRTYGKKFVDKYIKVRVCCF